VNRVVLSLFFCSNPQQHLVSVGYLTVRASLFHAFYYRTIGDLRMYMCAYLNPGCSSIVAITLSLMALHNVICSSDPVLLFLFLCSDEKATSLSWMRVTNTYEKINRAITNHRNTKLDQILFVHCEYLVILSNFDTFQRNKNSNVIRIKKLYIRLLFI